MTREPVTLLTVGHSNRPLEEFVALLHAHDVRHLVDVRRFPGSRKWPWFRQEELAPSLEAEGLAYTHAPELGGRRPVAPGSPNTGWRNAGFQGYADHMAAPAYEEALDDLARVAARDTTTVMCAEAVPWRCHRRLIADAFVARGHRVLHVMDAKRADVHALTDFARVGPDGRLTYPDPQQRLPTG